MVLLLVAAAAAAAAAAFLGYSKLGSGGDGGNGAGGGDTDGSSGSSGDSSGVNVGSDRSSDGGSNGHGPKGPLDGQGGVVGGDADTGSRSAAGGDESSKAKQHAQLNMSIVHMAAAVYGEDELRAALEVSQSSPEKDPKAIPTSDPRGDGSTTPLHWLARRNDDKAQREARRRMLDMLLEAGWPINVRGKDNAPPLFDTAVVCNAHMAAALLERGARPSLRDRFGNFVADVARHFNCGDDYFEVLRVHGAAAVSPADDNEAKAAT